MAKIFNPIRKEQKSIITHNIQIQYLRKYDYAKLKGSKSWNEYLFPELKDIN